MLTEGLTLCELVGDAEGEHGEVVVLLGAVAELASLTFLDPACGSGNFLTETYLSLRRLENEVIRERYHGQMMMGEFVDVIKVNINQFYGIEINDFAVTVATTALKKLHQYPRGQCPPHRLGNHRTQRPP